MARNVSDEELQLKKRARRRLVGAVVLVTAVAVVLPMILDSEPKPTNQNINIQIPSPDAGVLSGKLKPAEPGPAAVKPEVKAEPKAEPKAEEVKSAPKPEAQVAPKKEAPKPVKEPAPKPAAKPVAKPEPKPVAKPDPKAVTEATKKSSAEKFVVQVIALADADRAKALQAKIAGSGLKAYTEVVVTATGPVTRVRVGPYDSRDAAENARQKLQGMKLDGKVVPVQ